MKSLIMLKPEVGLQVRMVCKYLVLSMFCNKHFIFNSDIALFEPNQVHNYGLNGYFDLYRVVVVVSENNGFLLTLP